MGRERGWATTAQLAHPQTSTAHSCLVAGPSLTVGLHPLWIWNPLVQPEAHVYLTPCLALS